MEYERPEIMEEFLGSVKLHACKSHETRAHA